MDGGSGCVISGGGGYGNGVGTGKDGRCSGFSSSVGSSRSNVGYFCIACNYSGYLETVYTVEPCLASASFYEQISFMNKF